MTNLFIELYLDAVRHPPYEIVRRLLLILNQVTADEMQDQLRYI